MMSEVRRIASRWQPKCQCIAGLIRWRVLARVQSALYRSAVNYLSCWPLDWSKRQSVPASTGNRVVYYLRSFPTLRETFIQREIAALIKAGIFVEVIAHQIGPDEFFGEEAKALIEHTHYLRRTGRAALARHGWLFFSRCPLILVNLFLFIIGCKYDERKTLGLDLEVFGRAIYLAGVLKAKRADHVHAPWASIDAFVALVAARLVKIPYTVQARAYDIHRHTSAVGLPVKLANADFVITNSRYNESKLRSLLPSGSEEKDPHDL